MKPLYKQYYVFSPRVSITVPHPLANSAFKKSFVGVYEVSGGLNIMLYKGLFLGCTYKNTLFKIMENKIPDYNASMSINSVAGKIGGDWYIGDNNRIVYSMALSGGRNWTYFSSLICKTPGHIMNMHYSTTYVEPEVNLFFLVETNFGIGVTVAYAIFNRNFDPYEICLDDW
ncbi:MAG: hypothetical protein H0W84_05860, partial [Bacteroidetes bacterium]|nr:hypothetical protein [Bacteroidota bacterium]